jgi:branched-chain amino acid transport system ATP-binding protein
MTAVLQAAGVSVEFGGVRALRAVNLEVSEGSIVGLIGPNGAGKTTMIDAISGLVPYRGLIALDGHDLGRIPPHMRARRGVGRTWQSVELFNDLTVAENVAVAIRRPPLAGRLLKRRRRGASTTAEVDAALDLVSLAKIRDALPDELSEGQRKLAGLARAIATTPRVLCLDEPAAGLNSSESLELGLRLREIARQGTQLLLVDHDMGLVLRVCDLIFVLEFGEVIGCGPPDAVRRDERVIRAYLGDAADGIDFDIDGATAAVAPRPVT